MNMGLMNAFRTGNMILDVIICMLIPMIVRTLFTSDWPDKINKWIKEYITGERNYYLRSIVYETKSGGGYYYGQNNDLDSKDRNNLLQKVTHLLISASTHGNSHCNYQLTAHMPMYDTHRQYDCTCLRNVNLPPRTVKYFSFHQKKSSLKLIDGGMNAVFLEATNS